jgi:Flp pilus assembly protein TadD
MALWALGRTGEALKTLEHVISESPDREFALVFATKMAFELHFTDTARVYAERACKVNPLDPTYQVELARCRVVNKDWPGVVEACQRAIELNPCHAEAHKFLVAAYLRLGERAKAEGEFKVLMGLGPPEEEALRRWFEEESRRGGR